MKNAIVLALHREGLANGSLFVFRRGYGWASYINGDFMGYRSERPSTYAGQPLLEFSGEEVRKVVPKCVKV